uniref:J domain-containing protein n=1 Tax=Zooxanthella nutricula TaxID=1333877 RepID=A0A6U6U5W5_9DINO|mmetsp:Transcript_83230/g.254454  ORF Transcript_83230/g.254454 Transcript_83230/m.254454 type:complete len:246 (+) Transcript_83230:109-846(+)
MSWISLSTEMLRDLSDSIRGHPVDDTGFLLYVSVWMGIAIVSRVFPLIRGRASWGQLHDKESSDNIMQWRARRRSSRDAQCVLLLAAWASTCVGLHHIVMQIGAVVTAEPFDPFNILEVPVSATPKEIKRAYRRISLRIHPEKPGFDDDSARVEFMLVTQAYEALKDPVARAKFEETLVAQVSKEWQVAILGLCFFVLLLLALMLAHLARRLRRGLSLPTQRKVGKHDRNAYACVSPAMPFAVPE